MKLFGWLMLLLLVGGLVTLFRLLPAGAPVEDAPWKMVGQSNGLYFVALRGAPPLGDAVYNDAVKSLCDQKSYCKIIFWPAGKDYAIKLPMEDYQVAGQSAQWLQNSSTGLAEFQWSCTQHPEAPKDRCF